MFREAANIRKRAPAVSADDFRVERSTGFVFIVIGCSVMVIAVLVAYAALTFAVLTAGPFSQEPLTGVVLVTGLCLVLLGCGILMVRGIVGLAAALWHLFVRIRSASASETRARRIPPVAFPVKIGLCLLVALLTFSYIDYFAVRDFPNPAWGILYPSYSYDPAVGPPSPDLFDARPDTLVGAYLTAYIARAGTFPCLTELPTRLDENWELFDTDHYDSLAYRKPCGVTRPIEALTLQRLDIHPAGCCDTFGASLYGAGVTFQIRYVDGESRQGTMELSDLPDYGGRAIDSYWLSILHLMCWEMPYADNFYLNENIPPPTGYQFADGQCVGS